MYPWYSTSTWGGGADDNHHNNNHGHHTRFESPLIHQDMRLQESLLWFQSTVLSIDFRVLMFHVVYLDVKKAGGEGEKVNSYFLRLVIQKNVNLEEIEGVRI